MYPHVPGSFAVYVIFEPLLECISHLPVRSMPLTDRPGSSAMRTCLCAACKMPTANTPFRLTGHLDRPRLPMSTTTIKIRFRVLISPCYGCQSSALTEQALSRLSTVISSVSTYCMLGLFTCVQHLDLHEIGLHEHLMM